MSIETTDTTIPQTEPIATAPTRPARAPRKSAAKAPAKPIPARTQFARAKSPSQSASVMEVLATAGVPGAGDQEVPFIGGESPAVLADVATEQNLIPGELPPGMKMKHVFRNGVWEEVLVSSYQPDAVEMISDPRAVTLGDISQQWEQLGRSKMKWAWVHRDAKYSSRERSMGYGRVDPKKVELQGYATADVPGTGLCYVLQDVILMEIPKEIADRYQQMQEAEIRAEQEERRGIVANEDAELENKYRVGGNKLVSISRGVEQDLETFQNPILQEQAALARSMAAMGKLNPNLARDPRF